MNKKFFNDPMVKKWVPEEIVNWAEKIIEESFKEAINEEARGKVRHKIMHTLEVVKMGNKIIDKTPENKWNKVLAITVCLLHDIGRFPQVRQNSYSDYKTGIDHGTLGAKMVGENGIDYSKYGINGAEMVEAIMWHNKKEYLGKNKYAKFIRDADKAALFLIFDVAEADSEEERLRGSKIKSIVWERLEKREAVDNRIVESLAEQTINVTGWLWDLNLAYSKKLALEVGADKKLINMLKQAGCNEKEIKRLENNLEEFRKTV